jgi:hypothetical protein
MGVLAELVVAPKSEAVSVAESESPTRDWRGIVWKGLDQVKLGCLWCLVDREEIQVDNVVAHSEQFEMLAEVTENGPWVFAFPSEFSDKLAHLAGEAEEKIRAVGRDWAATDELRDWDQSEVADLLQDMVDLAETARLEAHDLLLWICL